MRVPSPSGGEIDVNVGKLISLFVIIGSVFVLIPTWLVPTATSWWQGQETSDQHSAMTSAGTSTEEVLVPVPDETWTPVAEPSSEPTPEEPPAPTTSAPPSAAPPPVAPAFAPTRISIPKLKINTLVLAKPTVTARNEFTGKNVPSFGVAEKGDKNPATGKTVDPMRVAVWWSSGPKVGALGKDGQLAVILGHTHSTSFGIFNELGKLKAGDKVNFASSTPEASADLAVLKTVDKIKKSDESALIQVLMNPPKGATVAMITCSGLVTRTMDDSRAHAENTVVFLGSPAQTPGS